MSKEFTSRVKRILKTDFNTTLQDASVTALYQAVSMEAMSSLKRNWKQKEKEKEVGYFSAEFLMGRLVYSNLYNLGLMEDFRELCAEAGKEETIFESIEDAALGNGGLGRLAACFLDSGATTGIQLNGYGIRYRYGLFKQSFRDGFQMEEADNWLQDGDPWSIRREEEKVLIAFKNQKVYAVPYDMPVIGYGNSRINTLRLWQSEPLNPFDFQLFNQQHFGRAVRDKNQAEEISMVLYPNDNANPGKRLRLKQEYFFSSASLQDMIRRYKKTGAPFRNFADKYAVQLNDTHPVVAIPEFLRLMTEEGMKWPEAFALTKKVFAYTNHTVMAEALEKWNVPLFRSVIPQVYPYIQKLQEELRKELKAKGIPSKEWKRYDIICDNTVHMARMAIFATHSVNGVAQLHTEILKQDALHEWYELYPERFNNKTNGITQRRWLALCNPELSEFITAKIGKGWKTDLDELKRMAPYADHSDVLKQFARIKREKKEQLAAYILEKEGVSVDPQFIFDVQIKRLHEYKRQLLNAFSILDIYFGIKEGRIKEFFPTLFLFGAKAAPGYYRAKAIIKFINEIAAMIAADEEVKDLLQVVFVSNYNVSYAEKIIPAADVSEQISTAGTEASGTGNMKLMLNGAVTLGTYDGANVEIVEQAGMENNYIFGARVEDIQNIKDSYDPADCFNREERIHKVVSTLVDGTFDDGGTGMFQELYDALLKGASWHKPDHYYLLLDLIPYVEKKLELNREYRREREKFTRKCYMNMMCAGKFSSDRTIRQYSADIWEV